MPHLPVKSPHVGGVAPSGNSKTRSPAAKVEAPSVRPSPPKTEGATTQRGWERAAGGGGGQKGRERGHLERK